MPVNIRIMNWNIEQLSSDKIQIAGMAEAIASVVFGSNIDILVILEVKTVNLDQIMTILCNQINHLQPLPRSYWLTSQTTGGEHYGFIIRDITVIRPLQFATNLNAPLAIRSDGTSVHPFTDLRALNWTTWPVAFPTVAPPVPPPRPRMGLINIFVSPENPRPPKMRKTNFGGQPVSHGGFSEGRGFRMPCLAMFVVRGPGGALTYLPIVVCHYASIRGGRNFLAQQQIGQLKQLHIAQLFSYYDALNPAPPVSGYLAIDGAAVAVENIIYTGDFNINFRRNNPAGGAGNSVPRTNRRALNNLTPTWAHGGSAPPPPATAGVAPAAPVVPFNVFPPAPEASEIPNQALRASSTTTGTILKTVLVPPPAWPAAPNTLPPSPANTLLIRGGAIDNFFYGGAEANTAAVNFGVNHIDSGEIIDVPALIEQQGVGGAPPHITVNALQAHYAASGTKLGIDAPRLAGAFGVAAALNVLDRWIGARLVSDHLPVVIEITCP